MPEGFGVVLSCLIWMLGIDFRFSGRYVPLTTEPLLHALCWLVSVNLYKPWKGKKREPQLRNSLLQTGLWVCLWSTVLMANICGARGRC